MILILASFFLSHVYIYILWHSIWHVFWHSILHSFWHSISLTYVLTFYLRFFLAIYSGILWHGFGSRWAPSIASEPCDPQSWRDGRDGDGEEEEGRGRRKEEEGVAPLLKSSDPHLPGQVGKNMEKYSLQVISTNRHFIQHIFWDSIGILTFLTDIYLFFWDTFWQIFWRSFCMTSILTFFTYSDIHSDILSGIFWHCLWHL